MRYKILTEMRIEHTAEEINYLIAHRGKIWLTNYDDDSIVPEINNEIGTKCHNMYDLIDELSSRPDVLSGSYDENTKILTIDRVVSMTQNPYSSLLIKKVVKYLGITKVISRDLVYDDEVEHELYPPDLKGKIPDLCYHGTSSSRAIRITKQGLIPGKHANWTVNFPKFTYICADPHYARFHATRTAENQRSFPVIFCVKVPTKSNIILDYDVATSLYGYDHPEVKRLGYSDAKWSEESTVIDTIKQVNHKTNLNTQIGIFGYKGRIPPSFIVEIYACLLEDYQQVPFEDWTKFSSTSEFLEALDIANEYGYWEPGMSLDDDYDDDED